MSDIDLDMLIVTMARDAEMIGCARHSQIRNWEPELVRIQDEIARAIQKIRERQAA